MLSIYNINRILNINLKQDKNTNKLYHYINDFYNDNDYFEKNSIILCLIYINRYKTKSEITEKNITRLIETCLILSNKFISDGEIIGKGPMELDFLETINWDLFVDEDEYNLFRDLVYSF